jgi:hypothetical protein
MNWLQDRWNDVSGYIVGYKADANQGAQTEWNGLYTDNYQ